MAARPASPKPVLPPLSAYEKPKRCLGPCRHCGVLVLGRVWHHGEKGEQADGSQWQLGRYELLVPSRTCVLGEPHVCSEQPPTEGA